MSHPRFLLLRDVSVGIGLLVWSLRGRIGKIFLESLPKSVTKQRREDICTFIEKSHHSKNQE